MSKGITYTPQQIIDAVEWCDLYHADHQRWPTGKRAAADLSDLHQPIDWSTGSTKTLLQVLRAGRRDIVEQWRNGLPLYGARPLLDDAQPTQPPAHDHLEQINAALDFYEHFVETEARRPKAKEVAQASGLQERTAARLNRVARYGTQRLVADVRKGKIKPARAEELLPARKTREPKIAKELSMVRQEMGTDIEDLRAENVRLKARNEQLEPLEPACRRLLGEVSALKDELLAAYREQRAHKE